MTTILVFIAFAAVEYGLGFAVARCLRQDAELAAYHRGYRQAMREAVNDLEQAVSYELAEGEGRFTTRAERVRGMSAVAIDLYERMWRS